MDWQVKPIARTCAVSGQELRVGDIVTCIVHKPTGGLIDRTDVLKDHAAAFQAPGLLLGKWTREVKERGEEEQAQRAQLLASREEFFLSLYENEEDPVYFVPALDLQPAHLLKVGATLDLLVG